MSTLALTIRNIEILNDIRLKLQNKRRLSPSESVTLENFLKGLPPAKMILGNKFPLDEDFEVEIFDIKQMWPHIEKWLNLFNKLPKRFSKLGIHAGWLDAIEDHNFWERKVVIEASFIPSFAYSRKKNEDEREIGLNLKADGTASFELWGVEDALNFPELYRFDGSWKEAYLMVVKTLQQGWPQTKFPKEFEQLLKK